MNRLQPPDFPSAYRGTRVAVFGATGFIGRWVARRLTLEGADIVCFVRSPTRASEVFAQYGITASTVPFSLADPGAASELLRQESPEVTINLIAYGVNPADADPDRAFEVNAAFPDWLAGQVADLDRSWRGNALVHVGTQYEYGSTAALHEDTEPKPETAYGTTKLAGTQAVMRVSAETGLAAVTARVFNVIGPGEAPHRLLPLLARTAQSGEAIELTSGLQRRDFCLVHDVAEALLRLGCAAPLGGDPVNVGSGRTITVRELVVAAAHQLQIDPELLRFGARPDRAQEVLNPRVSVERLRHLTGWLPQTSLAEAITRTFDFEQPGDKNPTV